MGLMLLAAVPLAAGAFMFQKSRIDGIRLDSANYYPEKMCPMGWEEVTSHPMHLITCQAPESPVTIVLAANHVVFEGNIMAGETSKSFAMGQVASMERNGDGGWDARYLHEVNGKAGEYGVIRKTAYDFDVFTAFLVRGNSTIMVTLRCRPDLDGCPDYVPVFNAYLKELEVVQKLPDKESAFRLD